MGKFRLGHVPSPFLVVENSLTVTFNDLNYSCCWVAQMQLHLFRDNQTRRKDSPIALLPVDWIFGIRTHQVPDVPEFSFRTDELDERWLRSITSEKISLERGLDDEPVIKGGATYNQFTL